MCLLRVGRGLSARAYTPPAVTTADWDGADGT